MSLLPLLLALVLPAAAKPLLPFPLPEPFEANPAARHGLFAVQERRMTESLADRTAALLGALHREQAVPAVPRLLSSYRRAMAEADAAAAYKLLRAWQVEADAVLEQGRHAWFDAEARLRRGPETFSFYRERRPLVDYRAEKLALREFRRRALRESMIPDGETFAPEELGLSMPGVASVRAGAVDGRPGLFSRRGDWERFDAADGRFILEARPDPATGKELLRLFDLREDGKLGRETVISGADVSETHYEYDAAGALAQRRLLKRKLEAGR